MFCSKCGTQIPEGSAFCPQCGNPTGVRAGAAPRPGGGAPQSAHFASAPAPSPAVGAQVASPINTGMLYIAALILMAVAALFVCIGGSYNTSASKGAIDALESVEDDLSDQGSGYEFIPVVRTSIGDGLGVLTEQLGLTGDFVGDLYKMYVDDGAQTVSEPSVSDSTFTSLRVATFASACVALMASGALIGGKAGRLIGGGFAKLLPKKAAMAVVRVGIAAVVLTGVAGLVIAKGANAELTSGISTIVSQVNKMTSAVSTSSLAAYSSTAFFSTAPYIFGIVAGIAALALTFVGTPAALSAGSKR